MARVLIHTLVFAPDGVSTAYLMTDLARGLKRLGHDVQVLTTTPHYNLDPVAIAKQPMTSRLGGLASFSECDGIPVWHVRMPKKGTKVAGRMVDYLYFHAISTFIGLFTLKSFDVVIAPSPPLTMGIMSYLFARLRGVACAYNVQEIYPDFAVNQGLMKNRAMIRAMEVLERIVYRLNDRIVPISEWFARIIRTRNVPDRKLQVIPNFVDAELYRPLPRDNEFARKHDLLGKFVILYGGNVGLSQDWDSMLYAAERVVDKPIEFIVVGDGVRYEWLGEEVQRRGLKNVRLLGYQNRELMPLINASCDVSTIPMKAATTTDTFPSKIYTILACGKPAIVSADADSELGWVIREARCGTAVVPDDAEDYLRAVLDAYERRASLPEEGARGREFILRGFTKEAVAEQYDRLIGDMIAHA